ncbi:MAG: tail fiber domain-containing protein [Aureispira sp.]
MNTFYKWSAAIFLALGTTFTLQAQSVGIGTGSPDQSAKLHIESNNQGLLIPQISIGNVNNAAPVTAPAVGLLVWNTNTTVIGGGGDGFYYWTGTQWSRLSTSTGAGTDDQNLTGATLVGNNLTITIENGAATSVDLSSLVNDADAVIGNEYNTDFALAGNDLTITDGGGARTVDLSALSKSGRNGLRDVGNFMHLGGPLIENTTVSAGNFGMNFNLNGSGAFHIQDGGVNHFSVLNDGDIAFGGDVFWRDASTAGIVIAELRDNTASGRFIIRDDGDIAVDLDANSRFVFNEQGLDRDFRIESQSEPNMFRVNASNSRIGIGTGLPARELHVVGTTRISTLAGIGDRMVVANANGDLLTQAIPTGGGGIAGVTAGPGLTGGGTTGTVTLNANADNGLNVNAAADRIRLGGSLVESTTVNTGVFDMNFNINIGGEFHIKDGGVNHLSVFDNGDVAFGGDVFWRDGSTAGVVIAELRDNGANGRFIIRENGGVSVDLDANSRFVFNEQGLDRDFRVESQLQESMLHVNASNNRVGIGTGLPVRELHVVGTTRVSTLAGTGNRMVVANANGDLLTQTVPANGDITSVNAGDGLTGGGTTGAVTLDANVDNGLNINTAANRIHLGGSLLESTTVNTGVFDMNFNVNIGGAFHIKDGGTNHLSVFDNGDAAFGGDVFWRDGSTAGIILADLIDEGDDGRFTVRENGIISIDLDANTQFVFNEQGLNRDFRVETEDKTHGLYVDAGDNNVGVGTANLDRNFHLEHDRFTAGGGFGGLTIEQSFNAAQWTLYSSQSSSQMDLYFNNNLRGGFDAVSGNYAATSDRRLKKNIEEIPSAMDNIMKLRPTMYHYKTQTNKASKMAGFIAQEVKEIFPSVVKIQEDDTNGTSKIKDVHLMSYTELLPFMVKGMQEQQAMIEAQQAQIDELKAALKASKNLKETPK